MLAKEQFYVVLFFFLSILNCQQRHTFLSKLIYKHFYPIKHTFDSTVTIIKSRSLLVFFSTQKHALLDQLSSLNTLKNDLCITTHYFLLERR